MPKHKFYEGIWTIQHVRNGKVIWEETKHNDLVNEGEQLMLDSFFRNQNNPAQFYVRLCYDSIAETDSLINILNEPSGNGYAAVVVERSTAGFPTLEIHEGDYRITSKQVTFTASGGEIGPVNTAYLATTSDNTGKLVAYVSLTLERTILDGDSMYIYFRVKLK